MDRSAIAARARPAGPDGISQGRSPWCEARRRRRLFSSPRAPPGRHRGVRKTRRFNASSIDRRPTIHAACLSPRRGDHATNRRPPGAAPLANPVRPWRAGIVARWLIDPIPSPTSDIGIRKSQLGVRGSGLGVQISFPTLNSQPSTINDQLFRTCERSQFTHSPISAPLPNDK